MKVRTFERIMRNKGYTSDEILELYKAAICNAIDAHWDDRDGMRDFGEFCAQIGPQFVATDIDFLENLISWMKTPIPAPDEAKSRKQGAQAE